MLCFGRSEAVLIVARVLQGISAAVVWTVGLLQLYAILILPGLALVVDTVGEARVGQAMAYVSSAMSMGLILGPVLGGVIYDRAGYYAAFALAFALILLDFVLRVILVEKKIAVRYTPSTALAEENTTAIKLQQLPLNAQTQEPSPASALDPTMSQQTTTTRPSKVPAVLRILKFPRLLVALFLSFVQALILSAFDATLPLYVNNLFNFTSLQAGKSFIWKANSRSYLYGCSLTRILHFAYRRVVMRSFWTQSPRRGRSALLCSFPCPPSSAARQRR